MRRIIILCLLNTISASLSFAQDNLTPDSFLGFPLGSRFPYHHQVVDYVEALAASSPSLRLVSYGQTYEGRPLLLATLSTPANLQKLEEIRQNHLATTGLGSQEMSGEDLVIIWLNFNIHGNEASCTNAALAVLHALAKPQDPQVQAWLEKAVILIDPCVNPDGYARYANWYNQKMSKRPNLAVADWEHQEDWPGGRFNHYLFDLNRDWAWQSQIESQGRTAQYRQWMPHIHVDFHEMSHRSTYFFAPASRPYHQDLSPWQKEFQEILGKNHQKYFDKNNWLYFTQEVYDLFYPSYGDTWPMFNGAIGFTYEQAGGSRGGLGVIRENQDTLTLQDRIAHHKTTALSTIETSLTQKDRLLQEFTNYFQENQQNPKGPYKSYVLKARDNPSSRVEALKQLLDGQQIIFGRPQAAGRSYSGYSYQHNRQETFRLDQDDLVISAYQPNSRLLKVLFEPDPALEDSLTYDLTAWALPYAYGLKAYATSERIQVDTSQVSPEKSILGAEAPFALIIPWQDVKHARFLGAVQQSGLRVRYNLETIRTQGTSYEPGSMIILAADNPHRSQDWHKVALKTAEAMDIAVSPLSGGGVEEGKDLGSRSSVLMSMPKVATLGGPQVYPTSLGAIWHYFEQDLDYPLDIIPVGNLGPQVLLAYNVLILPPGSYTIPEKILTEFAQKGGKIIALESGIRSLENIRNSRLASALPPSKGADKGTPLSARMGEPAKLPLFKDRVRQRLNNRSDGAIYKVYLDPSHPLAFGLGTETYVLKLNDKVYPFLGSGAWNVGTYRQDSHISGYVGKNLKQKSINSLAIGHEYFGQGQLIYFVDPYLFRGFWHIGKLVMANALFH